MRTSTYCDYIMSTIIGYNKFEELALLLFLYSTVGILKCRSLVYPSGIFLLFNISNVVQRKALLPSSSSYCHRMGGRLLRSFFLEPPDVLETIRRMNASSIPTTVKTPPIIANGRARDDATHERFQHSHYRKDSTDIMQLIQVFFFLARMIILVVVLV